MSQDVFDFRELTAFEKKLVTLAEKNMPKETRKFIRKEGNKLKTVVKRNVRKSTNQKTGNLLEGIQRGKPYVYRGNGALSIRVYGGKPAYHVHLLNNGHRLIINGKEVGFVPGKHFMEKSAREFAPKHEQNVLKFIDEMLDKGL